MNVQTHYEYICREGKYAHIAGRSTEKLVITSSGNLPDWAMVKGEKAARTFWAEDERHRDANARGYREIRIALMEELTDQQNIELVETFLQRSGIKDSHAYSYAIHDKQAAFNSSHRNIHAHIMFNEKIIEPERPLTAEQYFKKYSVRKDGTVSGGYKVSRYYSSREATLTMRQLWEDVVNEKYNELGFSQRISCKSLKEQMQEAEERQDYLRSSILDRQAAPRLGSAYRNPATMNHINELVRDFTEAIHEPQKNEKLEEKIDTLKDNEAERNLILFAQDLALRNVATEIRTRKEKEKEAMRQRALEVFRKKEEAELIEREQTAPWAVTVQDIIQYIEEKKQEVQSRIPVFNINDGYISGMTKENAYIEALNKITNGEYGTITSSLERLRKKQTELTNKESHVLQDRTDGYTERYIAFLEERKRLQERIVEEERKLKRLHENVSNKKQKERLQRMTDSIWNHNELLRNKRMQTLKEIYELQQYQIELENQQKHLASYYKYETLFTNKVPDVTTLKDSLYGVIPLRSLPAYAKDGNLYIEIEKIDSDIALGVRIGEETHTGSAKLYILKLAEENNKAKVSSVQETNDHIPLFQSYTSILENIKRIPQRIAIYKEKLTKIVESVKSEYEKLFHNDIEKQKERNRSNRNKDTDIEL